MTGVTKHTVVWLVRHGQTAWNRERRYLSRTDQPLTPFGTARTQALGWHLRRFAITHMITTGLQRTDQTAAAINTHQRTPAPIQPDPRWREADHGRWEGLTYAEVSRQYAAEARQRFADPWQHAPLGGEPLLTVQTRVRSAWHDLLRRHSGGKIVVVAHATPLQLILCDLLGTDPQRYWQWRLDLGSLTWLDVYPTAVIVRTINHVPTLRETNA